VRVIVRRIVLLAACLLLVGVTTAPASTLTQGLALSPGLSLGSRFNAVPLVNVEDISVSVLAIDPSGAKPAPVKTLQTETAAPRTAKVQPSKSAAAPQVDPSFSLPTGVNPWNTGTSGVANGYVNLDGTTRNDIPTPANLKPALGQMYHVTFYCACMECCGKTNAITASGERATAGVTVAASSSIPFGTRVWIEGYGERIVQDRGGAIGVNRLDVYVNTHQEALDHGSRMIMIWFL